MKNIIEFRITKSKKGNYTASAKGHFIVTGGKTKKELLKNIKEATNLYLQGESIS